MMHDPPRDRVPHAPRPRGQVDAAGITRLVVRIARRVLGPDVIFDEQMVRVSAGKDRDHGPNQGGGTYRDIAAVPVNDEGSGKAIADSQILYNQVSDVLKDDAVDRALGSKLLFY